MLVKFILKEFFNFWILTSYTLSLAAESGICSWYGVGLDGALTASGEHFNSKDFTAAHRTLPFGTHVVAHVGGRSTKVRINDRGPFVPGRILDVSPVAADQLDIRSRGVAHCTVDKA